MSVASKKDVFGCAETSLSINKDYRGAGFSFHRKKTLHEHLHRVETSPDGRGLLVGVSMSGGHRRRILAGTARGRHDFDRHSVYVRSFDERYVADLEGPMDFVLFEASAIFLQQPDSGSRLSGVAGHTDPVLAKLCASAAPLLARNEACDTLVFDQLAVTIATYLGGRYLEAECLRPRSTPSLSPLMEKRAKEMLRSRINGGLTIAEIADACLLSRSYFSQAFRLTTGITPHQWLTDFRLELAKEELRRSRKTLAQIATECGFSDQSHFTRAFTRGTGMSPGSWRKGSAA